MLGVIPHRVMTAEAKFLGRLRLFNEKADRLERCDFNKIVEAAPVSVRISAAIDKPTIVTTKGPGEDPVDAFVLTLRFFVQDNERISIRNIAMLYETSAAADKEKAKVAAVRKALNEYLDSTTFITVNCSQPTRRRIFEVFFYGGLSHANPEKHAEYTMWRSFPPFSAIIWQEFISIINAYS
jgi:hypothetical protein